LAVGADLTAHTSCAAVSAVIVIAGEIDTRAGAGGLTGGTIENTLAIRAELA
jgi:hypothetical protein